MLAADLVAAAVVDFLPVSPCVFDSVCVSAASIGSNSDSPCVSAASIGSNSDSVCVSAA